MVSGSLQLNCKFLQKKSYASIWGHLGVQTDTKAMHGVCTDGEQSIKIAWHNQQYPIVVEQLMANYGQEIYRFCAGMVADQHDAEELCATLGFNMHLKEF